MKASREQIYEALRRVYDTCSVLNGPRLDIVEMGLVEEVEIRAGAVQVRLLLTDPMCVYLFELRARIIDAVSELPGVAAVDVEPVAGKLRWPERMGPAARERLERRRRARLEELALTSPGPVHD